MIYTIEYTTCRPIGCHTHISEKCFTSFKSAEDYLLCSSGIPFKKVEDESLPTYHHTDLDITTRATIKEMSLHEDKESSSDNTFTPSMRIFIKSRREFHNVHAINYSDKIVTWIYDDYYNVEQALEQEDFDDVLFFPYSGIEDKDGYSIYAGDIMTDDNGRKGKVIFTEGIFSIDWGDSLEYLHERGRTLGGMTDYDFKG